MGKVDLATIARDPVLEAPVPRVRKRSTSVPLARVAVNPVNPRKDLGDLSDLAASLSETGQIQPCAVVTRAAFLALWPEHETTIGGAHFVVCAGSRRRAAAELGELAELEIVVRDELAESRQRFLGAAVTENIARRQFDPIEEALAVQDLVSECGSGTAVAKLLGYTKGWVSQRLALLKLSDEARELVRSGEIPVREARSLAKLEPDAQVPAWEAGRAAATQPPESSPDPGESATPAAFTAVNAGTPSGRSTVSTTEETAEVRPPSVVVGPAGERVESARPAPGRRQSFVVPAHADNRRIAELLQQYLSVEDLAELVTLLVGARR